MTQTPELHPDDKWNRQWRDALHPADYQNPEPAKRYNLVVIGAGPAGLVAASIVASLGGRVALVEKRMMGGDCLNHGCVPSKALIRSSRLAAELRRAAELGLSAPEPDGAFFAAAMERMRRVRARIAEHDSVERFTQMGVDVFLGDGHFTTPDRFEVDGATLRFHRAAIATGARPRPAPFKCTDGADYDTNETILDLTERPERLVVVGGGPIGCELAQAFARLGSRVTLIEAGPQFLSREDADAAAILGERFEREGIEICLDARVQEATATPSGKRVLSVETPEGLKTIEADRILVAVGRQPNIEGLGLEAAGVACDARHGIEVDDRLRTSNRRIYAAGDVCMRHKFTHAADAAARILVRNALFPFGRGRLSALTIPWCTYTDPEIAHVGLYDHEAERRGIEAETFTVALEETDRAVCDGESEGFVKVLVRRGRGDILGATVVAAHAGEMLGELGVAMAAGLKLGQLSEVIHAYPTQAEAIRKAGDAWQRERLTPLAAKCLRKWLEWTR